MNFSFRSWMICEYFRRRRCVTLLSRFRRLFICNTSAARLVVTDYIDIARHVIFVSVGSARLDYIIIHPRRRKLSVIFPVPALRGMGQRSHFHTPAVENMALEINYRLVAYLPLVVDPLRRSGRERVRAYQTALADLYLVRWG